MFNCFIGIWAGPLRTIVVYDADATGFEYVCVLIGFGVSDSVLSTDDWNEVRLQHEVIKSWVSCVIGGRGIVTIVYLCFFSPIYSFRAPKCI